MRRTSQNCVNAKFAFPHRPTPIGTVVGEGMPTSSGMMRYASRARAEKGFLEHQGGAKLRAGAFGPRPDPRS
jgi:hypothetical protein